MSTQNGTPQNNTSQIDLAAIALEELHKAGFQPAFSSEAATELHQLTAQLPPIPPALSDLRDRPWSSIDNDTSRDLDQVEVAERTPTGIRLQVAIADVAALVPKGSALDQHAAAQTQTVYTAVHNFPMLPVELSTGLTSLNQDADRQAIVMSFTVTPEGALLDEAVSAALVRNHNQLAYSRVGPWLEQSPNTQQLDPTALRSDVAPADSKPSATGPRTSQTLADQLKLQDEAAQALQRARTAAGALDFQRAEADPIVVDGHIAGLTETVNNRAMHLIEALMVAANGVMARALRHGGRSAIQRVVRVPQRWDRIVALAAEHGTTLPAAPAPVDLNNFLTLQRSRDPDGYPDLALAVLKLLGAGEYVLMRPTDDPAGHFGLAARDYAHSTAPNRRFSDLALQRIVRAMIAGAPAPYTDDELTVIAAHCNDADAKLRKIDRAMRKRVMAVAMGHHLGQTFRAVVTGASDKGVYVRVLDPPFEGRIVQGNQHLDVGDRVQVKLLHTDPVRAFIDFANLTWGLTEHRPEDKVVTKQATTWLPTVCPGLLKGATFPKTRASDSLKRLSRRR